MKQQRQTCQWWSSGWARKLALSKDQPRFVRIYLRAEKAIVAGFALA